MRSGILLYLSNLCFGQDNRDAGIMVKRVLRNQIKGVEHMDGEW